MAAVTPALAWLRWTSPPYSLALGALFARPKSEDIELTYIESRLEPFWQASFQAHIAYERQRSYAVPVADANVHKVTLPGQAIAVQAGSFTLAGTEHGESRQTISQTFDGKGLPHGELAKLVSAPKEAITDLVHFRPEGVLVVPPEVVASGVIARIIHQITRPADPQPLWRPQRGAEVGQVPGREQPQLAASVCLGITYRCRRYRYGPSVTRTAVCLQRP